MRSQFSLLLLSCLLASGCGHATGSVKINDSCDIRPAKIDDTHGTRDTSDTDTVRHFGVINAPCAGDAAENCCIKRDLDEIDNCKSIDSDCAGANRLLNRLFGETRHTKFANFIVYFDQDRPGKFTKHQPVLMWNRKNTRYLYGVQEVYILLFTEYKACFTVHGTTLTKSEPNPFELVLSILGKGSGSTNNTTTLVTKPADLIWYPLSGDADNPVMWLAIASVPVDVNTADWITVGYSQPTRPKVPKSDKAPDLPDECVVGPDERPLTYSGKFLAYNAFFSDNRESRVGVAVAFGATWTKGQTAPGAATNPYLNGYALAELYPFQGIRPKLISNRNDMGGWGRYRPSLGIAVGTNITNSPLNELLFGVSIGHLVGNLGVIAGVNYFLPAAKDPASGVVEVRRRQHRPLVGIEYSF